MPTGISAAANPCSERPITKVMKWPPLRAATSDPMVITRMHTSIISRLPWLSASRATTGVATAEVTRVAVTSQDTSSVDRPNSCWNPGNRGITMVCWSDTVVPARQSTAMINPIGIRAGVAGLAMRGLL